MVPVARNDRPVFPAPQLLPGLGRGPSLSRPEHLRRDQARHHPVRQRTARPAEAAGGETGSGDLRCAHREPGQRGPGGTAEFRYFPDQTTPGPDRAESEDWRTGSRCSPEHRHLQAWQGNGTAGPPTRRTSRSTSAICQACPVTQRRPDVRLSPGGWPPDGTRRIRHRITAAGPLQDPVEGCRTGLVFPVVAEHPPARQSTMLMSGRMTA